MMKPAFRRLIRLIIVLVTTACAVGHSAAAQDTPTELQRVKAEALADSLIDVGKSLAEPKDSTQAADAFATAAVLFDRIGNDTRKADALDELAMLMMRIANHERAVEVFEISLAIRRELGEDFWIAWTQTAIASSLHELGRFDDARQRYTESFAIYRSLGETDGQLDNLSRLAAISHYLPPDFPRATELCQTAIVIADSAGSREHLVGVNIRLGQNANNQGRYDESTSAMDCAIAADTLPARQGSVHIFIGYTEMVRGRFDLARSRFERALQIGVETQERALVGQTYNALGSLSRLTGDFAEALDYLQQGASISLEADDPGALASAYVGIGNTYNDMSESTRAIEYYTAADSVFASLGQDLDRATPINNIGTLYYFQADYERALVQFQRVLEILEGGNIESELYVIATSNIGEVFLEMGQYEEATRWMQIALDQADKQGADRIGTSVREIYGRLETAKKNYGFARELLTQSIEMARNVGEQQTLVRTISTLGNLEFTVGDVERASMLLSEAVSICREVGLTKLIWRPLFTMGRMAQTQGRADDAISAFAEAVDALETLRERVIGGESAQKLYSADQERTSIYEALIALLIEQGRTEEALAYLERSNNDELRKQLWHVEITDPETQAVLDESRELKAKVDQLDMQLANEKASAATNSEKVAKLEAIRSVREEEYISFVRSTVRENKELATHLSSTENPAEFLASKRNIPDDAAVVAYLAGKERLFIFVATAEDVQARVIEVKQDSIVHHVQQLYGSVSRSALASGVSRGVKKPKGKSDPDSTALHAEALYRILVEPIEDWIRDKDKLAILPTGHLHFLPFQILRSAPQGTTADSLLAERFTIFYLSNLKAFLRPPPEVELRIVAFGNADESLPFAEEEVNEIVALYPNTSAYLRQQATENRVKTVSGDPAESDSGFNVLHFATHATLIFGEEGFENSFLTLAPDSAAAEDGRLTLGEIWGIPGLHDYRLVTLSACQTALSDDVGSGWPVNPANAFLSVGVPTVVASLWEVDDSATSLLMERFYRNLPSLGAAASLRAAQLELAHSDEFSDPYFWAPFVVVGDWR